MQETQRDQLIAELLMEMLRTHPGEELSTFYGACVSQLAERTGEVPLDREEYDKFCVHPWPPFIPDAARVLFLGSFPPPSHRWSMDFYYPNFINDMWRILGYIFFQDKNHFILQGKKAFDRKKIIAFCTQQGIALHDAAYLVKREKSNASDKFLKILIPADIPGILSRMPMCRALVCTGEKSAEQIAALLSCDPPRVGDSVECGGLLFYRMPSSSRAYPMSVEKKSEYYRRVFEDIEKVCRH